ncbi:uncharacterized protein LOC111643480 [Copidosoma floridanum]|uniref:uncharacterized protein LOC111643480 n=1 Tax=Copidosoma floridanum TaxID=29053 RepID=UPI000C6FC00A|nr:uncharacterized protein LOC111643480 [Copidosoma floridanum]
MQDSPDIRHLEHPTETNNEFSMDAESASIEEYDSDSSSASFLRSTTPKTQDSPTTNDKLLLDSLFKESFGTISNTNNLMTTTISPSSLSLNLQYSSSHQGPFVVFLEPIHPEKTSGRLHPTTIGRLIAATYKGKIHSISSSGPLKVSIFMTDGLSANQLLSNPLLSKENLKASIPHHCIYKQGVIRDVPLDLTEDMILTCLNAPLASTSPVHSVKRLNRKIHDKNTNSSSLTPTSSVMVTFIGQTLPSHVFLYCVRYPISPFTQPIKSCFKCFRYGHVKNLCRSKHSLCLTCGLNTHPEGTNCPSANSPTCINCKGSHTPLDKACPEYIFQQKIHLHAATHNVSLIDASSYLRKFFPPNHQSRHSNVKSHLLTNQLPPNVNQHLFPSPSPSPNSSTTSSHTPHYSFPSLTPTLTSNPLNNLHLHSYASITKSPHTSTDTTPLTSHPTSPSMSPVPSTSETTPLSKKQHGSPPNPGIATLWNHTPDTHTANLKHPSLLHPSTQLSPKRLSPSPSIPHPVNLNTATIASSSSSNPQKLSPPAVQHNSHLPHNELTLNNLSHVVASLRELISTLLDPLLAILGQSHTLIPIKSSLDQLNYTLTLHDYDVIILLETRLAPHHNPSLKNFTIIRKDRQDAEGGGVAICIRNNIPFRIINSFHKHRILESLAISIDSPNHPIHVVAVYRPPSRSQRPFHNHYWTALLNSIPNLTHTIIGGDFNCHNPAWGSSQSCPIGDCTLSTFNNNNLVFLNDGSPTYRSRSNPLYTSCIDLTFVSPQLLTISNWRVASDNYMSDHYPISTTLGISFTSSPRNSHRFNFRKASAEDWSLFKSTLASFSFTEAPSQSTNAKYNFLTSKILEAASLIVTNPSPSNRPHRNKPSHPPWWNSDCAKADKARKVALRNFRRNPNLYDSLVEAENFAKKTFKKQKSESFKEFCENLSPSSPPSLIWNTVKKFRHKALSASSSPSNLKNVDSMRNLIDTLCPSSCLFPNFPTSFSATQDTINFFSKPFTESELNFAIKKTRTKINSAPGLDRIDNIIINKLPHNIRTSLLEIFNEIFSQGTFPDSWKEYLTFFIPKGLSDKYRPISLAQSPLKLLERLIHNRLSWWIEHHHLLPSHQFGFRKGKSCLDNLSILTSSIYSSFAQKGYTAALFLDVKSAFDCIDPISLIQNLKNLGLPENICRFFYNLTSSRKISFKVNGELLGPYSSYQGLPQGCISSPALYNLGTKDIAKYLDPTCKCISFADDIVIFASSDDPELSLAIIESNTPKTISYLNKQGLSIALPKSKLVIFTENAIDTSQYSLNLEGTLIPVSNSAKFLGIHLDSTLSWSEQLNHLSLKSATTVNLIRSLRTTWWGAHPSTLLNIHNALLQGSIDYALPCILPRNSTFMHKLGVIQRQSIRAALGLRNSTPNRVVYAESKILPLPLRQEKLAMNYISKSLSFTNHPAIQSIQHLSQNTSTPEGSRFLSHPLVIALFKLSPHQNNIFSSSVPPCFFFSMDSQQLNPNIMLSTGATLTTAQDPKTEFLDLFSSQLSTHTPFFTDGSKTDQYTYTGLAFYCPPPNGHTFKGRISPHASIFTAEALAIYLTLEYIIENDISHSIIFSDSRSSLESIADTSPLNVTHHVTIHRIKKALLELSLANKSVILAWIPSHKGIPGNEIVDQLAKDAISSGTHINYPLPYSDIQALFNSEISLKFAQLIEEDTSGKGLFYINTCFKTSSKPWFHSLPLTRDQVTSFSRMRSNHYNLAFSLHRKNLIVNPLCQCGNDVEDLNHKKMQDSPDIRHLEHPTETNNEFSMDAESASIEEYDSDSSSASSLRSTTPKTQDSPTTNDKLLLDSLFKESFGTLSNTNNLMATTISPSSLSLNLQYSSSHQGPFVVFLEPIHPEKTSGRLYPTTIGRLIAAITKVKSTPYLPQAHSKSLSP